MSVRDCWLVERTDNIFHKIVECYGIFDHDCTKKVWSCDTVGPGRNEADVEAAATGAGGSYVEYMMHQF
jgi:hypothetical protein